MEELFDIYDENLNHLGVKPRSQVHRDGDWHKSFHCWVIYRDAAGDDYIVMQKRAPDKDTFPDMFDISAAGHYSAGETLEQGVREIDEELGLKVAFEDLIPVGIRVSVIKPAPDVTDCEFNYVFFLINDQPLAHYQPNDELSGLAVFKIDDGLALCSGQSTSVNAQFMATDTHVIMPMLLHEEDFIPTQDNYFYKTLVLAKRCLNGEPHLLI